MIELLSLDFGCIRSFVEDQSISFQGRDKLIQIDGKNLNTGGSSGAGKSSVAHALLYLFDLCDVPTTVLQTRLTKNPIWASGKFLIDGVPATISRSKKEGLKIELPNETISGNSKLAEEKLDELIGLPREVFKKMIFKKQKEKGFFLSMTPQKMYEFLVAVLGLQSHIKHMESISADIAQFTKDVDDKTAQLSLRKSSLLDMERILSEKKQPVPTVHEDEIKQINTNILAMRQTIATLKAQVKEAVDKIPKPEEKVADTSEINQKIAALAPARAVLNEKLTTMDGPAKQFEAALNAIPFAIRDAKKVGEEISRIRANKEHIEQSQCPTCLQTWVGENAVASIVSMDEQIKQLITTALEHKKTIDSQADIESKLARLKEIRKGVEAELNTLQEQRAALDAEKYRMMEAISKENEAARNAYSLKKIEAENLNKAEIDKLNEQLKQDEISLAGKESEHNAYIKAASQYQTEVDSLKKLIEQKKQEVEDTESKLFELKKQIVVAEESKRLVKTYVLQMFQDTLDDIGVVASNIIAGIPNMATSTIYFEGCRETKSGSIKDEIVAIINMDGINDIPIKSLSGGEETTTDLAVDLAVIDVIETKVGKGANFFFMDEPFDGLDSVCKENCLEILKQLDTNKKIIMVDHSSELKEMVSDVILVVKEGDTSTISA